MAEVRIENVTKVYPGNVLAVKEATLHIADTELMVLVGPSGCGKSTTLRMVAGLEEISSGTISIGDRVVNDVPPKNRDIAMVFQNYALYPHMSVYNNMAFGLKLRGFKRKEIDERVQEAAQILGITELLERKPKALSGGQRQRVAVGRAIVRKPAVFLFDEPLSNLDAKLRVGMRAELNKLHTRLSTTMIYVTHDQIEAMTLGDRICVMNEGELQQVAPPLEIYDRPVNRFVAGFIGTPPMNFLEGSIVGENGALYFHEEGEGPARLRLPEAFREVLAGYVGKAVTFGVRPESISNRAADPDATDDVAMGVTINVVEPLGDEQILYLSTGKQDLIAKIDAHEKAAVGQDMEITINVARCHVFDAETGNNLTVACAAAT
ncbi:MAG: sn-glycerol-3-phosphate ABC transporter ATP-binding protein UgpC [Candidatus Brocadiae bacterium]|nr:sn-glycerol-3-phosphate ABC transporter ATP-binding protein UgpC [Candidatus Brocadiia bacterium]